MALIGWLNSWVDAAAPVKATIRAYMRDEVIHRFPTVAQLRTTQTNGTLAVFVNGDLFLYDAADTTTADDGTYCILSAESYRYKLAPTSTRASRNVIINGNFSVNQRAVSGTVTLAAGAYGHDRWKAGASGCTYTFSTSGLDTTLTISAGSLIQVIEGALIPTGTYVLKSTGTAQARIYQGAAPSYAAVNNGIVASLTGGTNTNVEFSTGTVGLVQVELGITPTTFERRDLEIIRCRRYFTRWTPPVNLIADRYHNTPAANDAVLITLPVPMRASPTGSLNGSFTVSNCSYNAVTANTEVALIYFLITGAGRWYVIVNSGTSFDFSAEL